MPSPIAHMTAGYIVYRAFHRKLNRDGSENNRFKLSHLLIIMGFALLPDIDSVLRIIMGDFGRYHNNGTHSLIIGLLLAMGVYTILYSMRNLTRFFWGAACLLSYELHVFLDMLTVGRGVMLFWPISDVRYSLPVLLFLGLHWSDGLFSVMHIWTILTEGLVALVAILFLNWIFKRTKNHSY
jgi:membrane-bound metal-dependent hydrolase YbcI (DUF457 family)